MAKTACQWLNKGLCFIFKPGFHLHRSWNQSQNWSHKHILQLQTARSLSKAKSEASIWCSYFFFIHFNGGSHHVVFVLLKELLWLAFTSTSASDSDILVFTYRKGRSWSRNKMETFRFFLFPLWLAYDSDSNSVFWFSLRPKALMDSDSDWCKWKPGFNLLLIITLEYFRLLYL